MLVSGLRNMQYHAHGLLKVFEFDSIVVLGTIHTRDIQAVSEEQHCTASSQVTLWSVEQLVAANR